MIQKKQIKRTETKKINEPGPTTYVLSKEGMKPVVTFDLDHEEQKINEIEEKVQTKKPTPKPKEKKLSLRIKKLALDMLASIVQYEEIIDVDIEELEATKKVLSLIVNQ